MCSQFLNDPFLVEEAMAAYAISCPSDLTNFTLTSATNYYDISVEGSNCPVYSAFFGVIGATSAMIFSGSASF
jgi:hypothetical protein